MVADQRILRGVAATLSWQPVDSDGESAAPSGAVTVQVTASDGTDIKAAGTATAGSGAEPRTVALTAAQTAELDLLTAVWTDAGGAVTTTVEVVGGYYFTLAEARASDPALADDAKFSTPALLAARAVVEEEFEAICGVAFVPRFARETVDAGGRATVNVRWPVIRAVRSVGTWDGDSFVDWTDLQYLQSGSDSILSGGFVPGGRYQIGYEHGYDRPPAEIKAAALVRLRDRASVPLRGIPDRATSFAVVEGGTYRLDQAGISRTGIPDVDAALARNDHRSRVH